MSNQITLGITEDNILLSFKRMVEEVLQLERKLRKEIYAANPEKTRDKVYRSYGEFQFARMMSYEEAMKRISDLRLGIALGFFHEQTEETMAKLAAVVGSAGVQKESGEMLAPKQLEIKRAELIRKILAEDSADDKECK
jgi:protein arginine kinase